MIHFNEKGIEYRTNGKIVEAKDGEIWNRTGSLVIILKARAIFRNAVRRERDQIRRDMGLVRVRGALGGVYWE